MCRTRPGLCCIALVVGASLVAADEPKRAPRTRSEFAKAISQLKEGMTESDVLGRLGRPDDIRTKRDGDRISTVGTREIWRYGTSGHLTPATLGQVYINDDGRLQYIFGQGEPPANGVFKEEELRNILSVLGQVPSYNAAWRYNPRKVIQAVNVLQPLGKDKALAAIDEFLRVASHWHDDGREGVFLVLRTLFEIPDEVVPRPRVRGDEAPAAAKKAAVMPEMLVGAAQPWPKDLTLLPRFPITIHGDIPFLLVEGYNLGGRPEQPESHVDYFRKHRKLRAKPLSPPDDPFKALDNFLKSPGGSNANFDDARGEKHRRQFLAEQLLRMMDTVYRVEPGRWGHLLPWGNAKEEAQQKRIIAEASKLRIRWDSASHKYTFLDGKSLPEPDPKRYRRQTWKPEVPGLDLEFTMRRDGPNDVSAWLVENYEVGKTKAAVVKVYDIKAKDKTLVQFDVSGKGLIPLPKDFPELKTGTSSTWRPFQLKEGAEVQIQVLVGEKPYLSPGFKP